MCTLSYIPVGDLDFFFTTNRDESPFREALFPQLYELNGFTAVYPKDKLAEGTWIICHEKNVSLCLLNGAFIKHPYKPPYRKSRGVMVLDYFTYPSTKEFILEYDFLGMEPFTIVVLNYQLGRNLEEVKWDGEAIHYRSLNSSNPHIWSSSTLYDEEAKCLREKWFGEWIERISVFSSEDTLDFHKNAGKGDSRNGVIMNRNNLVKTLSITQIRKEETEVSMYYEDLEIKQSSKLNLNKKSLK